MTCQGIKCKDYLTEEGPPAWCYRAGQPAQVAAMKCPKLGDKKPKDKEKKKNGRNKE